MDLVNLTKRFSILEDPQKSLQSKKVLNSNNLELTLKNKRGFHNDAIEEPFLYSGKGYSYD